MEKQLQFIDAKKSQPRGNAHLVLGTDRAELGHRVFIESWRGLLLTIGGIALVTLIGLFDYFSGPELSFSILYLLPIALAAWWGGFA